MSDPYQRQDLSNCGAGRLYIVINCGVLSVKEVFNLKEVEMRAYVHTLLNIFSDYRSVHDRNASL